MIYEKLFELPEDADGLPRALLVAPVAAPLLGGDLGPETHDNE